MNFIEATKIFLDIDRKNLNKKNGIKTRFKTRYKHKAYEIKDSLG